MADKDREIMVSICSITYNHAPFIRECLDGFLMQKTEFPYEIIINDDCSTDGTTEILREYESRYPRLIKVVYHEKNIYSQGEKQIFQKFVFPLARGKYVALCEGDDCWTDPLKIQKQVEFLENNPDYSLCFHQVNFESSDQTINHPFSHLENREYTVHEIFPKWTIPTGSAVFRSVCLKKIPAHGDFSVEDNVIFLSCATVGKMFCFSQKMGTYRMLNSGLTKKVCNFYEISIPHIIALKQSFEGEIDKKIFDSTLIEYYAIVINDYKRLIIKNILSAFKISKIIFSIVFLKKCFLTPVVRWIFLTKSNK